MEAQVEILEAKRKSVLRLQEWVTGNARTVREIADAEGDGGDGAGGAEPGAAPGAAEGAGPSAEPAGTAATPKGAKASSNGSKKAAGAEGGGVSRLVLSAQEDLRREIARAMHDGPAQSLTNIVLQAQIVERLVKRDPASAENEVRLLTEMVQQTLEATKSFIFDVRPMVLDDLGLVPTLRRAARERGRRAGIPIEFESIGVDRRLHVDLESGLFRLLDSALSAYVAAAPEQISLRLDWGDSLDIVLEATRRPVEVRPVDLTTSKDLPPALAAMVEDRRRAHADAVETALKESIVALPAPAWREVAERAAVLGIRAELLGDGARVHLVAELPAPGSTPGSDPRDAT
jgi:hypothetical protein